MMPEQSIREGFHTVTPYLMVRDAEGLIAFVKTAFGAVETFRAVGSSGGIHCEIRIGDSMLMIGGGVKGAIPAALYLYLPDVDTVYQRALQAGGTSVDAPADHDDGDRRAGVNDPFGNVWYIATYTGKPAQQ